MHSNSEPAVDVQITATTNTDLVNVLRLADLLEWASASLGLSGELGVRLTANSEITLLHEQFLGIAEPTDVITFPADDDLSEEYLGDIAVSIETAERQAAEARHSTGREVAFLCLHGLLHLAGMDDRESSGRERMLHDQEALLNEFERRKPGHWESAAGR